MCARCQKRVAVVFITKLENNQTINEGLCLKCAKDLGIKPVNDMLEKMGITEEDFDRLSEDMKDMFDNIPDGAMIENEGDDNEDGGAPAIELPKIFQDLGFGGLINRKNPENGKSKENKKGEKVQMVGFGTFEVSERPERAGRNPQTGEVMQIAASKTPKFKAGKALKDLVNVK